MYLCNVGASFLIVRKKICEKIFNSEEFSEKNIQYLYDQIIYNKSHQYNVALLAKNGKLVDNCSKLYIDLFYYVGFTNYTSRDNSKLYVMVMVKYISKKKKASLFCGIFAFLC